jgi:hypothetical protein
MQDAKVLAPEIKPVAMHLDRGKLITQEFISGDGHVLAGSPCEGRWSGSTRKLPQKKPFGTS